MTLNCYFTIYSTYLEYRVCFRKCDTFLRQTDTNYNAQHKTGIQSCLNGSHLVHYAQTQISCLLHAPNSILVCETLSFVLSYKNDITARDQIQIKKSYNIQRIQARTPISLEFLSKPCSCNRLLRLVDTLCI